MGFMIDFLAIRGGNDPFFISKTFLDNRLETIYFSLETSSELIYLPLINS